MKTHKLVAKKRQIFGRKVRALRRQGIIPGNVFGSKIKSFAVEFDKKALTKVIGDAGETGLVELSVEGETKPHHVLISGYVQNPVSGELLHADLHEVDLKQKTTVAVPVETLGVSPAVEAGNVLVVLKNEVEVEALPTDLPDVIEVDISGLAEVGASIHAKDLKVDRSKVTLSIEDEETIVTIQEPAKEEVVEAPAPADSSAEAETEAKAEGEAAPTEGGESKPEEKKE